MKKISFICQKRELARQDFIDFWNASTEIPGFIGHNFVRNNIKKPTINNIIKIEPVLESDYIERGNCMPLFFNKTQCKFIEACAKQKHG